jgi:serine/threonine-protein kinase RsbW
MRLSFDMPARLEAIDAMVDNLRRAAEPFLSAEELFGFEVAVSEAVTNVVKHAYGGTEASPARVDLTVVGDSSTITVELLDHGKPGPSDMFAKLPKLEDIDIFAEHGRGLALIQHYSDQADYTVTPQGNRLRLRFKASASRQPENE